MGDVNKELASGPYSECQGERGKGDDECPKWGVAD